MHYPAFPPSDIHIFARSLIGDDARKLDKDTRHVLRTSTGTVVPALPCPASAEGCSGHVGHRACAEKAVKEREAEDDRMLGCGAGKDEPWPAVCVRGRAPKARRSRAL